MGDFVTNPASTLPGPKRDLRNLPPGADLSQYLDAASYNAVRSAVLDLRAAVLDGGGLGGSGSFVNLMAPVYGVVGDGVTDDRAAIQAALDANPGKVVFAPANAYLVLGDLTLPAGTVIFGESSPGQVVGWTTPNFEPPESGTRFIRPGLVSSVFRLVNPRSGLKHITVMSPAGEAPTSGDLVFIQTQLTSLEGVTICGGWNNLRILGNGPVATTSWCQLDRCMFNLARNAGLYLDGTNGLVNDIGLRSVMILGDPRGWNDPGNAIGCGIYLRGYMEAVTGLDVSVWGGAKSLDIDAAGYERGACPVGLKFVDSWFDTATDIASINHVINARFISCWFVGSRGAGTYGMTVHACTDVKFINCEFSYNYDTGLIFYGASTDVAAINCNSANNAVGGSGYGYYVNFNDMALDGITLSGCTTTPWPGAGGGNRWGLMTSIGTASRLMVVNCTFRGSIDGQFQDNSVGASKVIANNFLN